MQRQTDKEISEAGGMQNYNKGIDCHLAWKCLHPFTFLNLETLPQICNLYCLGSLEYSCSLCNTSTLNWATEPVSNFPITQWSQPAEL